MALIRETLARGEIPLEDSFAYTPTVYPVVHHEWGAGAIAYFLATRFGPGGIVAAKFVLAALIALFIFLCLRSRRVPIEVVAFIALVGLPLMQRGFSTIRAQMYSFAFAACLLWFFDLDRKGRRGWLLAWIPLYVLWVNLHGGFLVALGFWGAHWLEQRLRDEPTRHLLVGGILMVGLIAINPYGLHYYPYLLQAIAMPRPYIEEWQPVWVSFTHAEMCVLGLSLVLLVYSVTKAGVRNTHGLGIVTVAATASILSTRLVPFYAVAWTCYALDFIARTRLGEIMRGLLPRLPRFFSLLFLVLAISFLARGLSYSPWRLLVPDHRLEKYRENAIYPVGAVNYLAEIGFQGNVMVSFDSGAYVSWKLYPDVRVSLDARYEAAYPPRLLEESMRFYWAEEGWQEVLSAYPSDLLLVHRGLPLADEMARHPGWERVYADGAFHLYARPGLSLPVADRGDRTFAGVFP
ncbi:MAG: hypothetical protein AB1640_05530 [bacterium]